MKQHLFYISEEGEKKAQGCAESPSFLYLVFIFASVWLDQRESDAGTEDRELIRLVSCLSCAPSDRRFTIFLPELFHFTLAGAQAAVVVASSERGFNFTFTFVHPQCESFCLIVFCFVFF